ncbi:MAG: hypothetical protein GF335_01010 [Candidatus Moranbacteria bacterium]|nr:hypothetical protein [Candidatus Moranbacteria bacterium]
MSINIVLILFVLFNINFARAQTNEIENEYYVLSLIYKPSEKKIHINPDTSNFDFISIGYMNKIYDTGEGSQFYAKISDESKSFIQFKNKSDRYYLGEWIPLAFYDGFDENDEPFSYSEEIEEMEVQPTIPYHPQAQKLNIYDAKTDELALSVDVSRFAKSKEQLESEQGLKKPAVKQDSKSENKPIEYIWIIPLVGAILLIAGGSVYIFWKQRKKIMEKD